MFCPVKWAESNMTGLNQFGFVEAIVLARRH
jgi:hypothetical protein